MRGCLWWLDPTTHPLPAPEAVGHGAERSWCPSREDTPFVPIASTTALRPPSRVISHRGRARRTWLGSDREARGKGGSTSTAPLRAGSFASSPVVASVAA
jgi:hypothetical protein